MGDPMPHDLIETIDEALDGDFPDMDYVLFARDDVANLRAACPDLFRDLSPIDMNCDPTSIQGCCVALYRGVAIFETTLSDEEWDAL